MSKVNTEKQKPGTTRIAIWLLFLGVWSSCVLGIIEVFFINSFVLLYFCVLILKVSSIAVVLFVVASIVKVKFLHGRLARYGLAEFCVLAVAILFMSLGIFAQRGLDMASRLFCGSNFSGLGKAFYVYAESSGTYPLADKWCDLLLATGYVTEKSFKCPGRILGRCHYAMNSNCEPNSLGDIVLLFEIKGGWNQHGGPELLTTENHQPRGCNVLFNDNSVRFVRPEDIGKLKWNAAKK